MAGGKVLNKSSPFCLKGDGTGTGSAPPGSPFCLGVFLLLLSFSAYGFGSFDLKSPTQVE